MGKLKEIFNSIKKTTLISGVILVLAVVVLGIFILNSQSHREPIIHQNDPRLSSDQLQERNKIIDSIKAKIADKDFAKSSKGDQFKLYTQLGSELFVIGKYDESVSAYKKAEDVMPENPVSYQEVFQVQYAMHDYRAAETSIKKAVKLNSASSDNWVNYLKLEKQYLNLSIQNRLKIAEEAKSKTNQADSVMNQYALILEEKGDLKAAYDVLREVLIKNPTNEEYHTNLDRINIALQIQDQQKQVTK